MAERNGLRAGFAAVDISPPLGTQIAGDIGRPRPTEEIRSPIYARAAVFEQDGRRQCLLVLDVLAINNPWADYFRDEIAARLDMGRDAVMVHTTQNHAAPSVGHFFLEDNPAIPPEHDWLRMGAPDYAPLVLEKSIEAVDGATAAMEPVTMHTARGVESRLAFNRRFIMRDGTSDTHAKRGADNVAAVEGPIDPELAIAQFRNHAGRPVGMLLHYTCHPTHGYPKRYVTSGWCGGWVQRVEQRMGGQGVAMVVNGCCGNIYEFNRLDPTHQSDEFTFADCLAETTDRLWQHLSPMEAAPLAAQSQMLDIPLRQVDPQTLAEARELVAEHPTPMWRENEPDCVAWDWLYALGQIDLHEKQQTEPNFPYEVQAFRIGELALLALIGEPFVEGQLSIKLRSPAALTLVAHMSNGYVGYIPTRHAMRGGGYETRTGPGSKLAPDALPTIVDTSAEVLAQLLDRPQREPIAQIAL